MPLSESFERSGEWLFRRRSYLPVLLFLIVVPAMWGFRYPEGSHLLDELWELFCLAVSLLGLALRSYAVGTTPSGTSGRNTHGQVASQLNTTGLYSVVRHPLYLGNYFMWLGVALFPRIWWLAVIISLLFWRYYERIMFAEEAFLRKQFGTVFETWAERTPAFLPKFKNWEPPALPFSWRTVLRREYSGFYGVIASLTFLEGISDFFESGHWEYDPMWGAIFGVATVIYLTLMTLKRRTRVLSLIGRS